MSPEDSMEVCVMLQEKRHKMIVPLLFCVMCFVE